MTQRVLVTGAAGFVGSHLVALLGAEQPAPHVVGWRRPNPDGDKARRPASDSPARRSFRAVDVLDADAVHRAVEELEPDQVYHCAGAAAVAGSWNARVSTLRTNVIGTEHLLAAIERAAPSARVLIPGSALVYRPGRGALAEDAEIGPREPLRPEQAGAGDAGRTLRRRRPRRHSDTLLHAYRPRPGPVVRRLELRATDRARRSRPRRARPVGGGSGPSTRPARRSRHGPRLP